MQPSTTHIPKALSHILKALQLERNQKLLGAIAALAFGIWLVTRLSFERSQVILGLISLTTIVVGIQLLIKTIQQWNTINHPLIHLIQTSSQRIVWVYSMVTVRLPFGVQIQRAGTIYFKLDDKDEYTVKIHEEDIKTVMTYLNQQLPQASFGHSQEKEQWYMASPMLLLQYIEEEDE